MGVEDDIAGHDWIKSNGHESVPQDVGKFSMARQEFKEECDINTIMERYQTTGMLPANVHEPVYVDFSDIPDDLMGLMARLDEAQGAFMSLPARVRAEFDNSPQAFVDFATQPSNLEQLRAWGLAPPAAPKAPDAPPPGVPLPGGTTQSST